MLSFLNGEKSNVEIISRTINNYDKTNNIYYNYLSNLYDKYYFLRFPSCLKNK